MTCNPRRLLAKAAIESLPEICEKLDTTVFDAYIRETEEVKKAKESRQSLLA